VKNGVVVVEDPTVLPEGAEVIVEMTVQAQAVSGDVSAVLMRHAGKGINLPPDLAERHDHYAHGKPRA